MSQKPRSTISRRQALKTVGAYSVAPFLTPLGGASHPLVPALEGEAGWVPRFFDGRQGETVSTICELIIPETDTPGAKAAKVHEYVDFVLSEEGKDTQGAFLEGIRWVDEKSQNLFGASFVELKPEQQARVLELISTDQDVASADETGVEFFKNIRTRTIEGYYTSEIGLVQELGYRGKSFLFEFPGCQHEEHKNWEPD
jgi:hypothetical protein